MSNARWLAQVLGMVKYGVWTGLTLFAIKIVASLSMTGIQKWIIDDVFLGGQYDKAVLYLSIFVIALIVYNAFHAIAARFIDGSAFRLFRILTERYMERLHLFPTAKLHGERTGSFIHHVTGDVQGITSILQGFLPQGIQHTLSFLLLTGFIGWSSPILLIAILSVSSLYIVMVRRFAPKVKAAAKEVQERRSDLMVHLEEGVSSSREVIAFHRLAWENHKFMHHFEKLFAAIQKEAALDNQQMLRSEPLRHIVTYLTLGIGGAMAIKGQISVGTLVVVFQFTSQLMESANGLYQFIMQISGKMAVVERLRKVLEQDIWQDGEHQLKGSIHELRMNQVSFRYQEDLPDVLRTVTAELPVGGKSAFVGTSGGGKSTISQLLIRFFQPTNGEINVNGIPLEKIRRSDWTSRIQIVFQEPYLFPESIRTNITMGRQGYSEPDLREACRWAQIDTFIESLPQGYDTELGERGITLSGGQRQRLAIARALLARPEILILDEATSALDVETERRLQEAIDEARQGLTTIIIAHRLSTVQNADVIFVMDQGCIIEKGTHETLLRLDGVYSRLSSKELQQEHIAS
ncbi:ABC transporter ATP-binding protein [Paenibacillus silviterrae]|uniref:ABC transporter ATP-binding protein n=1 Tax=Paenibacillus silviterrae TaxID=3242194 RepID=UPI002542CC94|nr:ABC transporter ATP-binding protein [Paenibacillus chinjuensis]